MLRGWRLIPETGKNTFNEVKPIENIHKNH